MRSITTNYITQVVISDGETHEGHVTSPAHFSDACGADGNAQVRMQPHVNVMVGIWMNTVCI